MAFLFFGSPGITPAAPIGLWTLSPRFSAVLLPLEPTIDFSDWSAVSPSKSRDFRFRWRHFRFRSRDFRLHAPAILFTPGQRFWARHPLSNQRSAVAFPVSNRENQSEARKVPPTSPLYYSCVFSSMQKRMQNWTKLLLCLLVSAWVRS